MNTETAAAETIPATEAPKKPAFGKKSAPKVPAPAGTFDDRLCASIKADGHPASSTIAFVQAMIKGGRGSEIPSARKMLGL